MSIWHTVFQSQNNLDAMGEGYINLLTGQII